MQIRTFFFVVTLGVLGACAATPPAATAPAPSAAALNAPTAVERSRTLMQQARDMGYTIEERNGERYFCTDDSNVGSHIHKHECLNEATFVERQASIAQNKDAYSRTRMCGNMGCSGMQPTGK
jgi:hypothetical protein